MVDLYRLLFEEWKKKELPVIIGRDINLQSYIGMTLKKIIVVSGFRRSGKTYLVFGAIKDLLKTHDKNKIIYVNFEDERIPAKTDFLTELIPALKQCTKHIEILFLDELHNIPGWSKWLRRIHDSENIRIFVTGSSSKMSSKEIPTELRGRFLELSLFPLSFKEFLRFNEQKYSIKSIDYSPNEKADIIRLLREYIKHGGLPEIVLAEENKKIEIVHSYYNSVIRRDIIERFKIRNEEALKMLIKLLLNSTSYTISKLYNTMKSLNYEVGKSTVQNFINHIENSYFLYSLFIFSPKVKEQAQCPRKTYIIDNCFISHLSTKFSDNNSRLYENTVFLELKRREHKHLMELFYWKNQQQEEVDFVIKEGLKVKQLIQVCFDIADYDAKKRETRALIKASKELRCNNLLVITENLEKEEKIKGKKIKYTPLWKWLLQ